MSAQRISISRRLVEDQLRSHGFPCETGIRNRCAGRRWAFHDIAERLRSVVNDPDNDNLEWIAHDIDRELCRNCPRDLRRMVFSSVRTAHETLAAAERHLLVYPSAVASVFSGINFTSCGKENCRDNRTFLLELIALELAKLGTRKPSLREITDAVLNARELACIDLGRLLPCAVSDALLKPLVAATVHYTEGKTRDDELGMRPLLGTFPTYRDELLQFLDSRETPSEIGLRETMAREIFDCWRILYVFGLEEYGNVPKQKLRTGINTPNAMLTAMDLDFTLPLAMLRPFAKGGLFEETTHPSAIRFEKIVELLERAAKINDSSPTRTSANERINAIEKLLMEAGIARSVLQLPKDTVREILGRIGELEGKLAVGIVFVRDLFTRISRS